MNKNISIYIFRVFCNSEGKFGNPVGIILDEKQEIIPKDRQNITAKLGFSESVLINNLNTCNVSIFNPIREVDFAGHALVGTAYFVNNVLGKKIVFLNCNAGKIQTWQENYLVWIRASLKNTPPWRLEQLKDAFSIASLSISQVKSKKHTIIWAWSDKNKGIIRARTFAPDWGIPEDEANGSGSMQLATMLKHKLEIHHGKGSVIYTKPSKIGFADVGGRVKQDSSKEIVL